MKLLIFSIAISFFSISVANAKEIDYCKTFWFDSNEFLFPPILKASEKFDCRNRPIPLQLSRKDKKLSANLEIVMGSAIPDYLIISLDDKEGKLDIEKFLDFIKKTEEYKENGLELSSLHSSVEVEKQADGFLIFSEIYFFDSKKEKSHLIVDYIFTKGDYISIIYFSKILNKNKIEMDFLIRLKNVFRTMRVGW